MTRIIHPSIHSIVDKLSNIVIETAGTGSKQAPLSQLDTDAQQPALHYIARSFFFLALLLRWPFAIEDSAAPRRAPSIKPALSCPVLTLTHHIPPPPTSIHQRRERERGERLHSSNGQGGERGAGARGAGAQGLRGPAAGAAVRRGGAPDVVLLPGAHRRVRRHAALPLHHRRHRHRLQGAVRGRPVRRRGRARHRLGLRRHDLRPRLLHRGHLGGPHQPGRHLRPPPGAQGLAAARRDVHRGAVRRRHRGGRHRQGHHEGRLPGQRRRRQHGRLRVLPRHGPRGGDRRHLRARLHRLLRHRPQAQRPRLTRPRARPAPHRLRRLHGAPRHHPHHRHRHQPRQEPRRRSHLQQEGRMGQPLDLLGWPVRRSAGGGGVSPVHPPGGRHQGAGLLPEQPEQLSTPAGRPANNLMQRWQYRSSIASIRRWLATQTGVVLATVLLLVSIRPRSVSACM